MSYAVSDLTLEITRRCNMKCSHCCRGGAQRIDMPREIISAVIDQLEYVPCLTITGGEPFLNPKGMVHAFDQVRWSYKSIEGFYIVTNGRIWNEEVIESLYFAYEQSNDKDMCSLVMSNDMYHAEFRNDSYYRNLERFECLPFFYQQDQKMENSRYRAGRIIPEGRGENISYESPIEWEDIKKCDRRPILSSCFSGTKFYDGILYINALGNIIGCPNLSYKSQKKFKLGKYDDIQGYLDKCDKSEDYITDEENENDCKQ